jgi:hypothetical protein
MEKEMTNLRDKLTVFVITCGDNPNYVDCLTAIQNQTCFFTYEVIKDFTPMSRALQEMINRCETPYYIEVDEDMILAPTTIEKMYNHFSILKGTPYLSRLAMLQYRLKDVHYNLDIFGIKIYDHSILKQFPYNLEHPSCEVEQTDRIHKAGYTWKSMSEVVGLHSPKWTNEGIFNRYYTLVKKQKFFGNDWGYGDIVKNLKIKLEKENTLLNQYAYLGAKSGEKDNTPFISEQDYTTKNKWYTLAQKELGNE